MKYYKLHLIRHGLTEGNLQGLYIGSGSDLPLCAEGRAQLKTLKKDFGYPQVPLVFTSPMLRATQTAEILFPGVRQIELHDLREMAFGKFEGKPLQQLVKENGLDVGFAYDGDADRCLAVDERGRVVDGDQILYVCGVYLNKHGRLSGGTVVPTIASNFGLIKSLELAGLSAVTSGVGDRHVYAKMREGGYSLGGEQTGHTIFGDIERTGDGIMTSLRVMEVIRAERETLSQLTAPCKLLPQAQVAVHVADKDAALENMGVQNAIAEAEAALAGEGRVLVRKSGTESVIRVLAEAPDQASADAAMKRIANALEAL